MTSTFEKYLAQIREATITTGAYAYRGQECSQWPLRSGATRRLIAEHGTDIVQDPDFQQLYTDYHRNTLIEPARTQGFGFEAGRRLSDLQVLAKLQHLGSPTGLLDFTWSPLVALWFACQDPAHDGKVFVINTNDPILVAKVSSDEAFQDLDTIFLYSSTPPHLSFWEPMASGDVAARILRQRSLFIIDIPFVSVGDVVKELTIPRDDKEQLLSELEILDTYEESMFKDVYGFAQISSRKPVPELSPDSYRRKGNRHYQHGEYQEASLAYSRSIELAPDVGLTYLLRGNAHAATGRHREAIDDYDKAVAQIDQLHRTIRDTVYFNRGNSKAVLSDYEGALQDYTEAINISPNVSAFYYNRGNIYSDTYRFEEAIQDYGQAADRESQNAAFNRGNALLALGHLYEAQSYLEAAKSGEYHEGVNHNLGTLSQILPIVEQLQYTVNAVPDPRTGTMCFRFIVPEEDADAARELVRFLFFGRAGNVGNTGGPGLSGGTGFAGRPPIRVYVDAKNEDRT